MVSPFEGIAVSTQPELPQTLLDPHDAVIVAHFLVDTIRMVFGNHVDKPSFVHSEQLPPEDNPLKERFIELFITNNQLIEYEPPLAEGQPRFVIRRDLTSPIIWQGEILVDALIQLVLEDSKCQILEAYRKLTGGE